MTQGRHCISKDRIWNTMSFSLHELFESVVRLRAAPESSDNRKEAFEEKIGWK